MTPMLRRMLIHTALAALVIAALGGVYEMSLRDGAALAALHDDD
jgi:hypothetical protein